MVRGRDACWEHCVLVDATRQKVQCNYCHREFSGGVYRMKFHLAQIKNKDIVPCAKVPDDVRDLIKSILTTPKIQKSVKKSKNEHAPNAPEHSSSAASGCNVKNVGSSGQHGSTCPSLLLPNPLPDSHLTADDAQKQKYDNADNKIALFFFDNSIPFSASKSVYYQAMVEAIANCGAGYKPPTYDGLRSTFLDKIKEEINENYRKLKDGWKDTGCTILSDSWSDGRSKSFLVLSVASPKGTHFLRLVDISSRADDAYYLFELLDSVIMEVGAENVVQVITDSVTASYALTSGLLLKRYPSIFWSPCASYCIEKMLEDISKQEWVSTALEEARTIAEFIYSDGWILNMVKKLTGGRELVRPRLSRIVTYFLTLRSIVIQEDNLKRLFSHSDLLSSFSRRPDAQAIKSLLYLERFWNASHEIKGISEPLLKLLRLVDGDMPAMGYIYEGIGRAKLSIKSLYEGCEEKYMPVLDIIEKRWSVHFHSHLHSAAAFLSPLVFYNQNFKLDATVRNGFHAAMWKMFPEENDRIELIKEQPVYLNEKGALGSKFAIMGKSLNSPGDWWTAYGYEIPVLQRAAMRILSQPCSSYWFKWNWSTFEKIYTKNLSNLELEKLNDLVFVHCNLRLQAISQCRGAKCRPVVYDEIDVSSEWPTESESSSLALDDSWLDNLIIECSGGSSTSD